LGVWGGGFEKGGDHLHLGEGKVRFSSSGERTSERIDGGGVEIRPGGRKNHRAREKIKNSVRAGAKVYGHGKTVDENTWGKILLQKRNERGEVSGSKTPKETRGAICEKDRGGCYQGGGGGGGGGGWSGWEILKPWRYTGRSVGGGDLVWVGSLQVAICRKTEVKHTHGGNIKRGKRFCCEKKG